MYIKVLIASVLSIVAIGCSSFQDNSTPLIILITPTDGATNVEREVNIRVTFDESMDISTCESRFGFFEGSITEIPSNMADHIPGEFSWNSDYSEMIFHPQDDLIETHDYSICLTEGMQSEHDHDGMMMDHDGGMMSEEMGSFGTFVNNGVIVWFTTQ